jgi:hypothetical protein
MIEIEIGKTHVWTPAPGLQGEATIASTLHPKTPLLCSVRIFPVGPMGADIAEFVFVGKDRVAGKSAAQAAIASLKAEGRIEIRRWSSKKKEGAQRA